MKLDDKFLKPYEPSETEKKIYKLWEESGFFNPDKCVEANVTDKKAETWCSVLPPPNRTGNLHTGHAFMVAIEDALARYNRMLGKRTLWLPGTDHAAIATQSRVEKILEKEGTNKHKLGREKFLERVKEFAQESHDNIINQLKSIGASLDWSREAYTFDEKRELAVNQAFKKMLDEELIYKGARIVNWDPKLQTTVSDDEVEWLEEKTNFYYLKYGPFTIGTSRPETKFGDKYIVVHPDDKRYSKYEHGQKIEVEWINGKVTATVIKDYAIDMEFGTGVMTITPWHDKADFNIAVRHNLDKEQIIDWNGKLLPIAEEFAGMKIAEARPKIIEKLKAKGLVEKIEENYIHNIATNSRGGGHIEPQIKAQWWINVNKEFEMGQSKIAGINKGDLVTLKKLMRHVVETGQVKIIPERFEKVYYHWIDNLEDWCISRQIWFGHQVPIWYKDDQWKYSQTKPEEGWTRDEDTLDTWFSSGLWTFSTLGWPNETADDLKNYHPTTILETGYDILFFWVARMILMSTYLLGEIPFKTVYLHGLVRDEKGRKMSKSLGNVVDPLDLTSKYGTDALRMAYLVGIGPGNDVNFSEDKVRAYKKFANKIWNVARFTLENIDEKNVISEKDFTPQEEGNKKIFSEFKTIVKDITGDIENYCLYLASEKIYHYIWHTFADKIIEESKFVLKDGTDEQKDDKQKTLYYLFTSCLKILHPFMPFVTEEIWQSLPSQNKKMLLVENWPKL